MSIEATIESDLRTSGLCCPLCQSHDGRVMDSRSRRQGTVIRRRRVCLICKHRFTTFETYRSTQLTVTEIMKALARDGVQGIRQLLIQKGLYNDNRGNH